MGKTERKSRKGSDLFRIKKKNFSLICAQREMWRIVKEILMLSDEYLFIGTAGCGIDGLGTGDSIGYIYRSSLLCGNSRPGK